MLQSLKAMFDVRDVQEDINLIVDDTVRTRACWVRAPGSSLRVSDQVHALAVACLLLRRVLP